MVPTPFYWSAFRLGRGLGRGLAPPAAACGGGGGTAVAGFAASSDLGIVGPNAPAPGRGRGPARGRGDGRGRGPGPGCADGAGGASGTAAAAAAGPGDARGPARGRGDGRGRGPGPGPGCACEAECDDGIEVASTFLLASELPRDRDLPAILLATTDVPDTTLLPCMPAVFDLTALLLVSFALPLRLPLIVVLLLPFPLIATFVPESMAVLTSTLDRCSDAS